MFIYFWDILRFSWGYPKMIWKFFTSYVDHLTALHENFRALENPRVNTFRSFCTQLLVYDHFRGQRKWVEGGKGGCSKNLIPESCSNFKSIPGQFPVKSYLTLLPNFIIWRILKNFVFGKKSEYGNKYPDQPLLFYTDSPEAHR